MHATPIVRHIAFTLSVLLLGAVTGACSNKEAEDVAAMRAMMEKQEQEKQEQRRKDAEGLAEMQRKADESRKRLGLGK